MYYYFYDHAAYIYSYFGAMLTPSTFWIQVFVKTILCCLCILNYTEANNISGPGHYS